VTEGHTPVLIVGAGPFGLAVDRFLTHHGVEHRTLGRPMEFWRNGMPDGMVLRSGCDWPLDPVGELTLGAYLRERGTSPEAAEPLALALYLDYTRWFEERARLSPDPRYVRRLDAATEGPGRFHATLDDGATMTADVVVMALGFGAFENVPPELARMIPPDRLTHTSAKVSFDDLAGRRCAIIGGRQSAFEWAALITEAGADAVHVVHRHDTPDFTEADWTWVPPLLDRMVDDPGWYRRAPEAEKKAIGDRMWGEGRLKLEPWLAPRLAASDVTLWPNAEVTGCRTLPSGRLELEVGDRRIQDVDDVILATGYRVDLPRVPLLARGDLLPRVALLDGVPVLDESFQTTAPGLYVTSLPAARDFGPFFGFTVSVRASAQVIGNALLRG
jgi:cation diffusion facilitator CzcD-associated flavoprotein CzcO